jgi:hypothetical protein
LVGFQVVLKTVFIFFRHKVCVRTVQVNQVVYVVARRVSSGGLYSVDELCNQLKTSFCFSLHQENDPLGEHLVVYQLLLLQFQVGGSLEIVVGLVEVLLLDLDLSYFIEC